MRLKNNESFHTEKRRRERKKGVDALTAEGLRDISNSASPSRRRHFVIITAGWSCLLENEALTPRKHGPRSLMLSVVCNCSLHEKAQHQQQHAHCTCWIIQSVWFFNGSKRLTDGDYVSTNLKELCLKFRFSCLVRLLSLSQYRCSWGNQIIHGNVIVI